MMRPLRETPTLSARRRAMAVVAERLVRLHMTLILLFSVSAGVLASKGLLALGVQSMTMRYPLDILAAYLTFLLGVRLWLNYTGCDGSTPQTMDAGDTVDAADAGGDLLSLGGDGGNALEVLGGGEEFGAVLLIGLVMLVVVGMGGFLVYQAPSILADAAFQMILASEMARRARRSEQTGWAGTVFRATVPFFLVVLAMAMMFAVFAGKVYPEAKTVSQVVDLVRHRGGE